jgi:hypothetical protein
MKTKLYTTPTKSLKDIRKSEALISAGELASTRRYGDLRPDGVRRIAASIRSGKNVAQALVPLELKVRPQILKILSSDDAVNEFLNAEQEIREVRKARKESRARYIESLSRPIQEIPTEKTINNSTGRKTSEGRIDFKTDWYGFTLQTLKSFIPGEKYDLTIPRMGTQTVKYIHSNSQTIYFESVRDSEPVFVDFYDCSGFYAVPHQE